MAVELGGITLNHLTHVEVRERPRLVRHSVPGMSGDLVQTLGRSAVEVCFHGVFYGENAEAELKQLRTAYLQNQPVDFFTEAVGEGYFAQVLIAKLQVAQRAGYLDQFDFICEVVEYITPPAPAALKTDPFGALNESLQLEAVSFVDDVQNALQTAEQLVDQITNIPSFKNPIAPLAGILEDFTIVVQNQTGVLQQIDELF